MELDEHTIEELISRMSRRLDYQSPYEHLYDWLKEKDPMLFAQWESVYAIVKSSEEY
jgi:hypothetical protein